MRRVAVKLHLQTQTGAGGLSLFLHGFARKVFTSPTLPHIASLPSCPPPWGWGTLSCPPSLSLAPQQTHSASSVVGASSRSSGVTYRTVLPDDALHPEVLVSSACQVLS